MTISYGPATLHASGAGQEWTEIGRAEGGVILDPPAGVTFYDGAVFDLSQLRRSVTVPVDRVNHDWLRLFLPPKMWRWHRIRSRCCNPAGNSPPMPKSGYDYNRRRRNRVRRKR